MSGVLRPHTAHFDVFEIWRAAQDQVGPAMLVRRLLVALFAGPTREEEPALQCIAPGSRLVNKITCGDELSQVQKQEGNR